MVHFCFSVLDCDVNTKVIHLRAIIKRGEFLILLYAMTDLYEQQFRSDEPTKLKTTSTAPIPTKHHLSLSHAPPLGMFFIIS